MADTKISQLPPISGADLADTDEFLVARASTSQNYSVARSEFFESIPNLSVSGSITVTGTVDGRDVAADGTKLDGVEAGADVTDTANVTSAGALMRTGGTMLGGLVLNADPSSSLDAATKQYVDTVAAAGIHYHPPVRAESPINIPATYNNGTAGVGATLTNSGFQTNIAIDGVTLDVNDRVLIYRQDNGEENGVYVVTDVGSISTNWVLTRATDADSYSPSDPDSLGQGDAFYVQEGDTGAGELYVMNTVGAITFGTTEISFIQISSTAIYSAANGIDLSGTVFSVAAGGGLTQEASGLAHADTSAQDSVSNTGSTVIQSMQVDGYGHVTVINSKTLGLTDFGLTADATELNYVDGVTSSIQAQFTAITSTTVSAGAGLTGGGDLTTNRTISHADTSSQASVNNSGATVIQDVTLDDYGHVTALTSAEMTPATVGAAANTAASIATSISLTGAASAWTFSLSGNDLVISYGATSVAKLDPTGNFTVIGDMTAFGSI